MNTNAPTVPAQASPSVIPAEYNKLVATAQLREIRLVKSEFSLDAEALGAEQASWKHVHSCEIQQSHYDSDDDLLVAWVNAEASCIKKRKKIVSAKCRYLIIYHVDGKPDDAIVNAFAKRVARFAAYPYFRTHFAELASQAGLFLPPLPIIKERKILPSEERKQLTPTEGENVIE